MMFKRLQAFIDWFFAIEVITSGEGCPPYLLRWRLLKGFGYALYLHHFLRDDAARDLHDHPRKFISIGLWGRYTEETPYIDSQGHESTRLVVRKVYKAPWIRSFPAEHKHRLTLFPHETCWTLVLVCRVTRTWGFWQQGKFVLSSDYIEDTPEGQDREC